MNDFVSQLYHRAAFFFSNVFSVMKSSHFLANFSGLLLSSHIPDKREKSFRIFYDYRHQGLLIKGKCIIGFHIFYLFKIEQFKLTHYLTAIQQSNDQIHSKFKNKLYIKEYFLLLGCPIVLSLLRLCIFQVCQISREPRRRPQVASN